MIKMSAGPKMEMKATVPAILKALEPGPMDTAALSGNIDCPGDHHYSTARLTRIAERATLSPFAFHWQKGERVYLYHSLLGKKIYGPPCMKDVLEFLSLSPAHRPLETPGEHTRAALFQLLPLLLEGQFLCFSGREPRSLLEHFRRHRMFTVPDYRVLYLMLTHECNHRCPYCFFVFFSDTRPSQQFMEKEVALKGIEFFEASLGDAVSEPVVIFYGGEPLLNWPVLSAAVRAIRQKETKGGFRGHRVSIELFTNGTLLTRAMSRFLKEHQVTVALSLDGKEHHHALRKMCDPRLNSYRRALRGLGYLRDAGHDPAISLTVGRHNCADLGEIVGYFSSELGVSDIRFFPVRGLPSGDLHEVSSAAFNERLLSLWPLFREKRIEENMLIPKVRLCAREHPLFFYCEAMGGQVALMPDGSVGPCINCAEDYLQIWGKLGEPGLQERLMAGELTSQWLRRSPLFRDECERCIGLGNCGGGCPHEAFTKTGSLDGGDARHCSTHPLLTKWAVEILADSYDESSRRGECP